MSRTGGGRHFTARIQCRKCSHEFTVCVHVRGEPTARDVYTVTCPENASRVRFAGEILRPAEECPAGAVVVRPEESP